jgi:hypothetical protein
MIRYPYVRQINPPAPFIKLTITNPLTDAVLNDVPAQLDTAADRIVIPEAFVQSLNLHAVGAMKITNFGGGILTLSVYPVLLRIHEFPEISLKVIAHTDESWVLLGRDVLNSFRVTLDGPHLALELG